MIESIKLVLAILTVIGQFVSVFLVLMLLFRKSKLSKKTFKLVSRHVLRFSFTVALIAMLGSLFYSEIAGYEPCKFCWYQRIMMYPQVLLLLIAMWIEDYKIVKYLIGLSSLGFLLAVYHYLLQLGLVPEPECSELGYSVSCADNFSMTFGYITIPLMAVTAFSMILLFGILRKIEE